MSRRPAEHPPWGDVLDLSDSAMVPPRQRRERLRGGHKRLEAMAWALFSAGGFVAAFLIPAHLAILGIAFPAGWLPDDALSYERMARLVGNPLTKLYLLALISLPLFHWAHRFRFAIHHQFGIHWKRPVAWACYGTAVAGTVLAVIVVLRV
jgi:fumarate reductase subunit D